MPAGGPSEAYYHSVQWWVVCLSQVALPVVAGVFMPVFYELRLTSIYEVKRLTVIMSQKIRNRYTLREKYL